ncbi:neurotensin/neuromedin N [Corythoichthys intestinalis]|uniref:neurotensin/neuromedin N n=1 Tax=Corythoichthys intestinalis TaxID=161448 RepID=UPI0025A5430A|nr:neurotensin/neuromedin N [Corythoichthys intestinalis]XP_061812353.1 neurotensin/neuromedin N-like [Nerophis lumbriciformis]
MQAHLTGLLLLLCFTCSGLCADMEQEQRSMGEDLFSSLFASKLKETGKQSAPYWRLSLENLCRLSGILRHDVEGEEEAWWKSREEDEDEESEEEEEAEQQIVMREWSNQRLEELYSLKHICRALLHSRQGRLRHESREYMLGNDGDAPLKRKSPYILKRQASHAAKSRRPYILKRSDIY